jgi:hypothetical protein
MAMKIFEYKDYDEYKQIQTDANKLKLNRIWVSNFSLIEIQKRAGSIINSILCHGTRNGAEQTLFKKKYPNAKIIGTEISDTASQFPMTVQWDFMEPKEEWINQFEIVYSNSLDHSIDPLKTITTWVEQLSPIGHLYIDHGFQNRTNTSTQMDPLELSQKELEELITQAGGKIVEIFKGKGVFRERHELYDDVRYKEGLKCKGELHTGLPTEIYMVKRNGSS